MLIRALLLLACLTLPARADDLVDRLLQLEPAPRYVTVDELIFPGIPFGSAHSGTFMDKITDEHRERILQMCQENPRLFPLALGLLPDRPEVHAELARIDDPAVRKWLRQHTGYYRDELIAAAEKTADPWETYDLEILARVDWARAEPIVLRLTRAREVGLRFEALRILAEHRPRKARDGLLQILDQERDYRTEAAIALFNSGSFPSARASELLGEDFENLPEEMLVAYQDVWIAHLPERRAIEHLLEIRRPESVRLLLRWLADPDRAEGPREALIDRLDLLEPAEYVPALKRVLECSSDARERSAALSQLTRALGPEAVPLLRQALRQDPELRNAALDGLHCLGELDVEEVARAVESFVRAGHAGRKSEAAALGDWALSRQIDGLVTLLAERSDTLRRNEPEIAEKIDALLRAQWPGSETAQVLITRLLAGRARPEEVHDLLASPPSDPRLEGTFEGQLAGLTAVITRDQRRIAELIGSSDREAQRALLAAARLTRQQLPRTFVTRALSRPELRSAAAAYAMSAGWRRLVDDPALVGGIGSQHPGPREAELLAELKMPGAPSRILLWTARESGEPTHEIVVRIWPDRAEATRTPPGKTESVNPARVVELLEQAESWPWFASGSFHPKVFHLTSLSPEGNWRTGFSVAPAFHEGSWVDVAQKPYTELVTRMEALAPGEEPFRILPR